MTGSRRGPIWTNWITKADPSELREELGRLDLERSKVYELYNTVVGISGISPQAPAPPLAVRTRPSPCAQRIPTAMRSGYVTVPPEQVPARPDWDRTHIPIVGRIAAGQGVDTIEAESHPPGWCGEFLVYTGAPRGAVAVRIVGESMMPEFRPGDIVIVDPSQHIDHGVGCALLEEHGEREPVLKEIARKGANVILKSRAFLPPRIVPASSVVATCRIVAHLPRSPK